MADSTQQMLRENLVMLHAVAVRLLKTVSKHMIKKPHIFTSWHLLPKPFLTVLSDTSRKNIFPWEIMRKTAN